MVAGRILGVVMGKALFERIPLKCYLNYTILRQLCGQPVQMNDVFSYDKDVADFLFSFTQGGSTFLITLLPLVLCRTSASINTMSRGTSPL